MLPGLRLARSEYENDANDRDPCERCEDCRGPDCLYWDPDDEPDDRYRGPALRSRWD